MFDRLLESRRQPRRPPWHVGTSIGLHALIISGAVWATRSLATVMPERTVGPVAMIPFVEPAPEADEAPVLLRAGRKVVPAGMAGVPARVEVQFIIGTDGRVEADSVTVLSSTSRDFDAAARAMIVASVHRPGRRNGTPVRVLVRRGVIFAAARDQP